MNRDSEKWLDDRITEEVIRMAEKRRKQLMESEELKDIDVSADSLERLKKRLAEMNAEESMETEAAAELTPAAASAEKKTAEDAPSEAITVVRRPRIRLRAALAAALVAVLVLGVGIVGSGKKVYLPVVSQREDGDEKTTKVNNDETNVASGYDEEEVCQEIEDKLGVLPVRFGYRPKGMELTEFLVNENAGEVILNYEYDKNDLHLYISKDIDAASIYYKVDGEIIDSVQVDSLGMELKVHKYTDSEENMYYQTSFEYLNTYYSFSTMMDSTEFANLLENIWIKNVE